MENRNIQNSLETHVRRFFKDHICSAHTWKSGPIIEVTPDFKVLEIAPGPRIGLWSYVSIGAWEVNHSGYPRQEFILATQEKHDCQIEYLAMIAHYHLKEKLNVGHTVPLGKPWLPDSPLDHLLVSIPYPYGPELEIFDIEALQLHFRWLLPIYDTERAFRHKKGLEELEKLFDDEAVEFWDDKRLSVV